MEKQFIETLELHQNIIHKVCSIYSNTQDEHDDLFQEIVLQLWKSWKSFQGQSKITTWMYKVALHTALTHIKKVKRARDRQQEVILEIQENEKPEIYGEDDYDKLQSAIGYLNKPEKAIILLYLENRSYKEIAEIMGITESNTGVRINRIKTKLKDLMK